MAVKIGWIRTTAYENDGFQPGKECEQKELCESGKMLQGGKKEQRWIFTGKLF
jgi:hypothetical protein